MTDDDRHDQQDDDLRALLRAADPAASLPAADPERAARLLEDTMTDPHLDESRADGTRGRSRLTWLVAAAAALVIGAGIVLALAQGDDEPEPTAGDPPAEQTTDDPDSDDPDSDDPDSDDPPTVLTASGPASARCLAPEAAPQVVASQEVVFDGVVESISGNSVTLMPTRWYAGDETERVVVQAPGPDLEALLAAVTFTEGSRYLVAATDGQVTLCQFTAEWTPELAAVYDAAFPR